MCNWMMQTKDTTNNININKYSTVDRLRSQTEDGSQATSEHKVLTVKLKHYT